MKVTGIQVGELETNCYIYRDESTGRCAIIDPGEMNDRLRAAIEEAGRASFDYILLTHCHFDHVGGVSEVRELTGAPVAIQKHDAAGLRDSGINLSGYFFGQRTIYPPADLTFDDGETFYVGETKFTVMHTPGHTVGSCCYITEGLIFSGDTLFRESAGRTDFPGGSASEMSRSLQRLMALEGDYIVYPGHEGVTTLSNERVNNPYVRWFGQNH